MELAQTNTEYSDKYIFHYNSNSNTIVCTTVYKGQTIRGIAKCSPEDSFDMEAGKRLAYLRCRKKFAKKKCKRASKAYRDAVEAQTKAEQHYLNALVFWSDAMMQLETINDELVEFENLLNN